MPLKRKESLLKKLQPFLDTLKCQVCGHDTFRHLEFHHLDPKDKSFKISTGINNGLSYERIVTEIEKCACLCSHCHKDLHGGFLPDDLQLSPLKYFEKELE